jgi:hypothetical protein
MNNARKDKQAKDGPPRERKRVSDLVPADTIGPEQHLLFEMKTASWEKS